MDRLSEKLGMGFELPEQPGISRVCVVSSLYHPILGGLGRQAVLLTETLAHSGVPLFVIARRMEKSPFCAYDPIVDITWVYAGRPTVHILEEKSLPNLITSLRFSLGALFTLLKRRKEYQIVHFHGASIPLMVCILPLKFLKKRVIALVAAAVGTEAGSLQGRYPILTKFLIWLIRKVDRFIAISHEIKHGLLQDQVPDNRIIQIPNFVDTKIFRPASEKEKKKYRDEKGLSPSYTFVTFSGRLVHGKGLQFLFQAWQTVQKEFPQARLLILGDSPTRSEFEQYALELGIKETLEFRGLVHDVATYLKASDIFVFPSLHEGLPNALLEAMACGLPIVATRIGGVMDVINPRFNGLLVEPGNPHELMNALIYILQNPEKARSFGRQAAQTIQDHYTLEKISSLYIDLYQKLSQPNH